MDDLRITGGHLVDPASGISRPGDLAVAGGLIRAVGTIEPEPAHTVVDATGLLVTPGLIDMHTHLHAGASFWGMDPDAVAWHTGVTTWVDAGSVGAYGLGALLEARKKYRARSGILLNISAHGLAARTGELRDLAFLDTDAAVAAIAAHRDSVLGIKVRIDPTTVGDNGLEPLRIAIRAGEVADVPVMVHIGSGSSFTLDQLVDLLRPGDIITHCAGRAAIGITVPGQVRDSLHAAYERGVVFDIGHGAGGFKFEVIEAYLEQDMPPQVISTDLHVLSASGPAFDLPVVMAKLLAVGMNMEQIFAATTATPARVLGLAGGTLAAGTPADIALFHLIDRPMVLGDVHGTTRIGRSILRAVATYVGGAPLPPAFPQAPPTWVPLSDAQRTALARREQALREMLNEPLVAPADVFNQIPTGRGER